jgi:hypothetical protein
MLLHTDHSFSSADALSSEPSFASYLAAHSAFSPPVICRTSTTGFKRPFASDRCSAGTFDMQLLLIGMSRLRFRMKNTHKLHVVSTVVGMQLLHCNSQWSEEKHN